MVCVSRAGLASIRRAFSTIQLRPRQWSSASAEWPQNLDATPLKTFPTGKSFLRFHELSLSHKFYSMDESATVQNHEETQAILSEDENPELQYLNSEAFAELNKPDTSSPKRKWKLVDAIREMCQAVEKGDEEVEDTLNHLGVHLSPLLARFTLEKIDSPSLALRFFQWAKLKPGFKHDTPSYDRLMNILGGSKDFENLQKILSERLVACCRNSANAFSFATVWHNDPVMLNKIMEMFDKLEISLRRDAYEMLIAAFCKKTYVDTALEVLKRMANADCAPTLSSYRAFIELYCWKKQMDKAQEVFEMMKDTPQDSFCYNLVLSALCRRKEFDEAIRFLQSMVDMGCKPDAYTYNIMIRAACKAGKIEGAIQLFDRLKKERINPLYTTYWHLLDGLFKIKGFGEAHSFLIQECGKDSKLDTSIYNYFIRVCNKSRRHQEAHDLLLEKKINGFGVSG